MAKYSTKFHHKYLGLRRQTGKLPESQVRLGIMAVYQNLANCGPFLPLLTPFKLPSFSLFPLQLTIDNQRKGNSLEKKNIKLY